MKLKLFNLFVLSIFTILLGFSITFAPESVLIKKNQNDSILNSFEYEANQELLYNFDPIIGPSIRISENIRIIKTNNSISWDDVSGFIFTLTGTDVNFLVNATGGNLQKYSVITELVWGEQVLASQWWNGVPLDSYPGGAWNIIKDKIPRPKPNPMYNRYISFDDLIDANSYFKNNFLLDETNNEFYLFSDYRLNHTNNRPDTIYMTHDYYDWLKYNFTGFGGECNALNCSQSSNGGSGRSPAEEKASVLDYDIKLVMADGIAYEITKGISSKIKDLSVNNITTNSATINFNLQKNSGIGAITYKLNDEDPIVLPPKEIDGNYSIELEDLESDQTYLFSIKADNQTYSELIFKTVSPDEDIIYNINVFETTTNTATIGYEFIKNNGNGIVEYKLENDLNWIYYDTFDESHSNNIFIENLENNSNYNIQVRIDQGDVLNSFSFKTKTILTNHLIDFKIESFARNFIVYSFTIVFEQGIDISDYDIYQKVVYQDYPGLSTDYESLDVIFGLNTFQVYVDTNKNFSIEIIEMNFIDEHDQKNSFQVSPSDLVFPSFGQTFGIFLFSTLFFFAIIAFIFFLMFRKGKKV